MEQLKKSLLTTLINSKMNQKGLSYRTAARQISIAHTTLINILEGAQPDIPTLIKICYWLDVKPHTALDAMAQNEDAIQAKVALLIQKEPRLARQFLEAMSHIENLDADPQIMNDIIAYITFRLQLL